jgi:ABC-type Na+ efflux pump permease subunit
MNNLFPNAWHIARREYLQRTRTRTFLIVTLILALVGFGLSMFPIVVRLIGGDEVTRIAVDAREAELEADPVVSLRRLLDAGDEGAIEVTSAEDPEAARQQAIRTSCTGRTT